jgi:flavin reductase (DIM6/NTAB) family NADH-FMN oxidoreductase RutF
MNKIERAPIEGLLALPGFPLVLVTVGHNIMTAAAFAFGSFKPPCVMIGILPENLTHDLIVDREEFGINLPSEDQLDAVRLCGSVSGREADKFARAGLTPQKAIALDSDLIAECPLSLECKVVHTVHFGGSHNWFVGEILAAHIDEDYAWDRSLLFWRGEYRRLGGVLHRVERR